VQGGHALATGSLGYPSQLARACIQPHGRLQMSRIHKFRDRTADQVNRLRSHSCAVEAALSVSHLLGAADGRVCVAMDTFIPPLIQERRFSF
jgi:hypothetical protein